MGFDDYRVQPGDTFISIAMKFDMSVYYLLRINRLSEVSEIFPDMILKVKHKEINSESKQNSSENVKIITPTPNIQKDPKTPTEIPKKIDQHHSENIFTTDVLYCTFEGEIKGQLCIFPNRLAFNPALVDNRHCEIIHNSSKKLMLAAHAQTFICFWDIFNAIQYELPPLDEDQPPMHFIQFFLLKIGKETKKNTPKWCVNFQLIPVKNNYAELKGKALRIINSVTEFAHNPNKIIEDNYHTFVPYYEINENSGEDLDLKVNEPKGNCENKDLTEQNIGQEEIVNKNVLVEEEKNQINDIKTNKEAENSKVNENETKVDDAKIHNKEIVQPIEEVKEEGSHIKISRPKQNRKIEENLSNTKVEDIDKKLKSIEEEIKGDKNIKENVDIKSQNNKKKIPIEEPHLIHLNSEPIKNEASLSSTEESPLLKTNSIDSFKDEVPSTDHDEIRMPWSTTHKHSVDIPLTSSISEKIRIKHTPRKSSLDSSPQKVKSEASFEDIPIDEPEEPILIPLPDLSEPSSILSENMIKQIVINLPTMYQIRSWKLVYSPKLHGTSLSAFYRSLSKSGSSIIVILDQYMHVFGGLASDKWAPSHQFYGNGDCFLFTFHNTKKIKVFLPTLENEYFMSSSFEGISMGSGGKSGFYIYGDLMKGSSGVSSTYNNEVLSKFEYFNILKLEVWALV